MVTGGTLRPGVSLRSTPKVSISIDLDRVKPIRIHFRRIEHDVVSCAITSKIVRLESLGVIVVFIPVCDIPLMHESDALRGEYQDDARVGEILSYLAYLSEKGGEFSKRLDPWLIERA